MTVVDTLAALSEGSLPSNEQILAALQFVEGHPALRGDVSADEKSNGQSSTLLRRDTQDLVHSLQGLLLNRNGGQEVQEIIWKARGGVLKLEELVSREEVEKRKEEKRRKKAAALAAKRAGKATSLDIPSQVRTTANKVYSHGFALIRTILIQPELRHLLTDLVFLAMQIGDETFVGAHTAAAQAVDQINPNATLTLAELQAIKDNVGQVISRLEHGDAASLVNDGGNAAAGISASANTIQLATVDSVLAQATSVKGVGPALAAATTQNAKRLWKQQGRRRALQRARQLLIDVQKSPSSQQSLLWILSGIGKLAMQAVKLSDHVASGVQGNRLSTADVTPHLIALVENFVGPGKVTELLQLTHRLSIGFHQDEALRGVLTDSQAFLHRCAEEAGWALELECETQFDALLDRFKGLSSDYQNDCRRLLELLSSALTAIRTDAYLLAVLASMKQLGSDLTLGGGGTAAGPLSILPSKATLHEIFHSILPPLFRNSVLPIPRIKYTHPDFVLVLENIAISLRDLLPDTLDFRLTNDFHVDLQRIKRSKPRAKGAGTNKTFEHCHLFKIKIKGLGLRIHKVAFAVDLLKGIKLHDKGILDLTVRDVGVSIYIDIPKDAGEKVETSHCFRVRKVRSRLGKLSVKVRQSNHAILHKLAEGLVDSAVTKLILRKLMNKGIVLGLQQLDVALMQLKLNNWIFITSDETRRSHREQIIRLKKQAAELRDLMVQLREQAGTLEIDFLDPGSGQGALETWKDKNSSAWDWIRKQFVLTGKGEVKRGDTWQSNVFDLRSTSGKEEVTSAKVGDGGKMNGVMPSDGPAHIEADAQETQAEAQRKHKPQGPTTQATVEDADQQVKRQKRKYWPWFKRKDRE